MQQAIGTIWAVGRNYAEHAKELGNPLPKEPLIFTKPGGCALENASSITLTEPLEDGRIHFETELALRFGAQLEITHWALALDLTNRLEQKKAKEQGLPWTRAKGFKNSCPLTAWTELPTSVNWSNLSFELWLDDQLQQKGQTKDMIFSIPQLTGYLINQYPVQPGDILLTGTPAGVGPLLPGQKLRVRMPPSIEYEWQVSKTS